MPMLSYNLLLDNNPLCTDTCPMLEQLFLQLKVFLLLLVSFIYYTPQSGIIDKGDGNMKSQIIYEDEELIVGTILFDYQELIQQAYTVTKDPEIAKAFADVVLSLANDLHYNYGFFEIVNGVPKYNTITEATIQCLSLPDNSIEQYKEFANKINKQVEQIIQYRMWYNKIRREDDER